MTETIRFGAPASAKAPRSLGQAVGRGARLKCPACGVGPLFYRYLKVNPHCPHCGEALHHQRADDAPPYFTVFIVGHVIIGLMLSIEVAYAPPLWLHMALWIPLTFVMALALLPVVKGALVGYQWALYMHGFDPEHQDEYASIEPAGAARG